MAEGFTLPIQVVESDGISAWLAEDHSVPVVSLSWSWQGGAGLDAAGEEGATALMASLLTEGAGDLRARDFADALRDDAIALGFESQRDGFEGGFRALREAVPAALRLARLAMAAPRFDADALQRVRARAVAGARQIMEAPAGQARRVFWAAAYPDHPAGRPSGGTAESLAGLSEATLRAAHARQIRRDGLLVAAAGAISAEELRALLVTLFAALPAGAPPPPPPLPGFTAFGRRVVPMAFPQSTIIFGQPGLSAQDPDWEAAQVMLRVLGGGGFSSRLMQAVRVERGLTYGISAGLDLLYGQALITGGLATENAKVAEALAVTGGEWRRMAETGPTEAERGDAIAYLTGSLPLQFTDSRRIASTLLSLRRNDRPLGWLAARPARLAAITRDQLAAVAGRLLKPDAFSVVIAGQPDGL
ncbi:MAG TPA: pitrilysin family protein [Roseomonas sp.]|jgi:zinc protease